MSFLENWIKTILNTSISKPDKQEGDNSTQLPNYIIYDQMQLINEIKNIYMQHGIPFENFNIFGIRNTSNSTEDLYNDFIGIITNDQIHIYKGTTDPGVFYTKNPLNKKGAAHLCLGYHKNIWIIGKHANKYDALVQRGGKVKIWRDANKDFENNDNIIENGFFGINCHHGYSTNSIGKMSAGCQVIQDKNEFKEFLSLCKQSNKKKFSYFLFLKSEIPFEVNV